MSIIDAIRKKVGQPLPEQTEESEDKSLPDDLEPFKLPPPPAPKPAEPLSIPEALPPTLPPPIRRSGAGKSYIPPEYESLVSGPSNQEPALAGDKVELILQKLETIDARLRFIEERLRR
ncbi:MAG: hypothetical protein HY362_00450 [Candidatus Aenigmarchaeota archaeon]|nr:hypothetical protein [Candidatus Aenigmarchaeota archaeon]